MKYRVIEDWWSDGGAWLTWGMFYENCSGDFPGRTLLTQAIPDDDRRKGRYFGQQVERLRPTIEEAEVVLGEYADRYRVRPEIRTVEGENHREIRARLWEIIFEELEKQRSERQSHYVVPEPAYYPVREQADETGDER